MASALERTGRMWLEELRADVALAAELGEDSPLFRNLQRRVTVAHELFGDLSLVAECAFDETPTELDVVTAVRAAVSLAEARSARHGVSVDVRLPAKLVLETRPGAFGVLVRALLHHAVAATTRGGAVAISLTPTELGTLLSVEDGGPLVPEGSGPQLIQHRVDPTRFGRPAGVALLIAEVAGAYLGGTLELRAGNLGRNEAWLMLPRKAPA
jgi:hypothetical protein